MVNLLIPRLIRLNRRMSWLLFFVSSVVLLMGYGLTVFNFDGPLVLWGHWVLGVVFALLLVSHMCISVGLIRYRWGESVARILRGKGGSLTLLRFAQRVSGWVLALSASLVLLSGLDWFKVGTGWLVPFTFHVRFDIFFVFAMIVHGAIGLNFALMRRRLRRKHEGNGEVVSTARREAIAVLAGMFISLVTAFYLDRIPRVSNVVERIKNALPPGQYEVSEMRMLHVGSAPVFDEETWTLEVAGLVQNPLTLSYSEVKGLPRVISVSDFHCVTGWSKFGNMWEGVQFRTVMGMVKPLEEAKYALVSCEHGYSTSLPLEDLVADDVILAYRLDDRDLPPGYGGPLRLVVPHKYGYKSAKWVRRIEFVEENELGYWESRGYSDTADPFTNDRYSG